MPVFTEGISLITLFLKSICQGYRFESCDFIIIQLALLSHRTCWV